MSLGTKLLADKVLHCVSCGNLLSVPIILVENVGNNCQECFQSKYAAQVNMRNNSLEKVLLETIIPCKFTGCKEKMKYELLTEHYQTCKFHNIDCPMKPECPWTGITKDLPQHFEAAHKKQIIAECDNNSFIININLNGTQPILKMLKSIWRPALFLFVKFIENRIDYHLCEAKYFHLEQVATQYKYNLRHLSRDNNHVEMECKLTALNQINNSEQAAKLDLDYLKEITGEEENVFLMIKPIRGNFDEKLFEILECPRCNSVMRPPIFICVTGHSICAYCKEQHLCPRCESPITKTRNYVLEEITGYIYYPCKYAKNGCEEVLFGTDIERHETFCTCKGQRAVVFADNHPTQPGPISEVQIIPNREQLRADHAV